MNRLALTILCGLGLVLGSIIVIEASPAHVPSRRTDTPTPPVAEAAMRIAPEPPAGRAAARVAVVLARPLFSHRRRPPAAVASNAGPQGLPRLTAILISPGQRVAIFAPTTGKPLIAGQGGRIGLFTVRSIAADHVTVLGADGIHVLHTAFGASAASATAARTRPPGLLADLAALHRTSRSIVFDQGTPDLPNAATWSGPPPLSALPPAPQRPASAPMLTANGSGH